MKSKPKRQENGYPSIDWLRNKFIYDTETGRVLYKETYGTRGRRHTRSLTDLGWIQKDNRTGYTRRACRFYYDDGTYKTTNVSRVAWAMSKGEWPKGELDHIDGDPFNNKIENLRDVDHTTNGRNQRTPSNNTSGVCGVYINKNNGTYIARIKVNYQNISLGSYKTLEEAKEARKKAEIEYGFHENHGREKHND